MNAPCKDCPDRWADTETFQTCHSTCEKYKAFKKFREEINKKTSERARADYWQTRSIRKSKKKGGKR